MIIKKLTKTLDIPKEIADFLKSLEPYKGGEWSRYDEEIKLFKQIAKEQLTDLQDGKCAYCGLRLNTRAPEIEHIAPKGGEDRPKHVEFTFLPLNLVMACRSCNSPTHKGQKETILNKSTVYTDCEFAIVHPYLDDPNNYFEFVSSKDIVDGIIQIPKKTASDNQKNKARFTIEMFGLDTEGVILARAEQQCYEKRCSQMNEENNNLVEEIVLYKPGEI